MKKQQYTFTETELQEYMVAWNADPTPMSIVVSKLDSGKIEVTCAPIAWN